jgi:membrane protease YdiL (CAAX protease family)
MNSELQTGTPPACLRCGSALTAEYHFCPNCAQEWRPQSPSLGLAPEPVFNADTRIRQRSGEVYVVFSQYLFAMVVAFILTMLMLGARSFDEGKFPLYQYLIFNEICAGLVTLWVAYRYRYIIRPFFNIAGLMTPTFLGGLLLLPVMIGFNWVYNEALGVLMGSLQEALNAGADRIRTESIQHVVPTILLMCLLPAITEEIACRAFMFTSLRKALTIMGAALWSSVLFATLHLSLYQFPVWFVFGLYLCWMTHRTKSVLPAIIIHCLYNYFMIFLIPAHHAVR